MYYIDFWANYWKNLAELTESTARQTAPKNAPLAAAQTSAYKASISPEDKYAYLAEYGTQMLALFGSDGACNYISKNFESITGHGKHCAAGHAFFELFAADGRERLQELIRLQHSSPTTQVLRAKLTHANGKSEWYMLMLHPKRDSAQAEVVCVMENIHENILTQNTLQKARMEAELALRSRSEFLAGMSHDLRTPLNAVLGFSQMITGEVLGAIDNPQYSEYARHIQESGYDLLAKIEDLLEIASIEAGHVTLDRSSVRMGEILKQVVDAQAHHTQGKGIRLVCDATHKDVLLNVDRVKIQHILGHLVANAIKHCTSGSQINIRTGKLKDGGIRLRVTDNGVGIDNFRLGQIKTALLEKSCWTSKHSHGIGIGLALAKEFAELHGGDVAVESEAGSGTSVDILLPRDCVDSPAKVDYIRQLVG